MPNVSPENKTNECPADTKALRLKIIFYDKKEEAGVAELENNISSLLTELLTKKGYCISLIWRAFNKNFDDWYKHGNNYYLVMATINKSYKVKAGDEDFYQNEVNLLIADEKENEYRNISRKKETEPYKTIDKYEKTNLELVETLLQECLEKFGKGEYDPNPNE
jgi:hypothetical protein